MNIGIEGSPAPFVGFSKIPRWVNETCTVTEKIDGTNGCLHFADNGYLTCQTRNRTVAPGDDSYGFAAWAHANREELFSEFGTGYHFGEWWGQGVQRKYGQTTKRFSAFNVHLWPNDRKVDIGGIPVDGVPILVGEVSVEGLGYELAWWEDHLRTEGSRLGHGFMNPEGLMVYLHLTKRYLKFPFDPTPKGKTA